MVDSLSKQTGNGDHLSREVWLIAAVFISGAIMSILDTTIVNVALDRLSQEFKAPLSQIQWVITGYMLALAMVIPLTGWAVERFGAKRLWLGSLTLFVLGSVLSGAAWSVESLIGFRVLQGFGGGMIMPVGMTMLTRAAGPQRVGRVMGFVGVPMLLGPILGPVIGGLIVDQISWRWIFYVNFPIGILALIFAAKALPKDQPDATHQLDWRGFLLLSPGLAAAVYGLAEIASNGGVSSLAPVISLGIGVFLVVAFIFHALRVQDRMPLLDLRLFKDSRFSAAAATSSLLGAALFGAMILFPLYYQLVRGDDALTAGLMTVPQGVGAAMAMPIAGKLADRNGPGPVILVGLILSIVSTLAFVDLTANTSDLFLGSALWVRGIGLGMTMMPAMSAAYQTLSNAAIPRATSTMTILQRVGGSVGTAILAVTLENNISSRFNGSVDSIAARPEKLPPAVADTIASAFSATFWVATLVVTVALIPALLLLKKGKQPAQQESSVT